MAEEPFPVHGWFSLSYASYLVVPRSLLQEMPGEWQQRFVRCLTEMQATFEQPNDNYTVLLRGEDGRIAKDPFRDYRHPDQGAIAEARTKGEARSWLAEDCPAKE